MEDVFQLKCPFGSRMGLVGIIADEFEYFRVVSTQIKSFHGSVLCSVDAQHGRFSEAVYDNPSALIFQQKLFWESEGLNTPIHHYVLKLSIGRGDCEVESGTVEAGGKHLGHGSRKID